MTTTTNQTFRPLAVAAIGFGLWAAPAAGPWPAFAAELGALEVRSYQGQPLDLRIVVAAGPGELVDPACFRIARKATSGAAFEPIATALFSLRETAESRILVVRTPAPFNDSAAQFQLRNACDNSAPREYTARFEATQPVAPEVAQLPVAAAMPATAAAAPGRATFGWTVRTGDSYASIARALYPQSAGLQSAYVEALREANPAVSGTGDLPPGTMIRLPKLKEFASLNPKTTARARMNAVPVAVPPAAPTHAEQRAAAPAQPAAHRPSTASASESAPEAPAPAPPRAMLNWTVRTGDSYASIARALYPQSAGLQGAYVEALREANPDVAAAGDLPPGTTIRLPDLKEFANLSPKIVARARTNAAPAAKPRAAPALAAPAPATPVPEQRVATPAPPAASKPRAAPAPESARAEPAAPPPPTAAPKTARAPARNEGFQLRLSGAEMDLSLSRGVTETMRAGLRDKQLILEGDDQVSAILALNHRVKQLEQNLNELQLKLTRTTPGPAPAISKDAAGPIAPPRPAETPAPAATASAPPPVPTPAPAPEPVSAPATQAAEAAKPSPVEAPAASSVASEKTTADIHPAGTSAPPAAARTAAPVAPRRPPPRADESWYFNPWLIGSAVTLLALIVAWFWARRNRESHGESLLGMATSEQPVEPEIVPRDSRTFSDWASDPAHRAEDEAAHATALEHPLSGRAPDTDLPLLIEPAHVAMQFDAPLEFERAIPLSTYEKPAALELDTRPATDLDLPLFADDGDDRTRRAAYIAQRFPELANEMISPDDPDSIINAARLSFEDGYVQRAAELLTYAFEERPGQLRFWLALFEIYRLERMTGEFSMLAAQFKDMHGGTDVWPKVQHIGRELDPSNPLYAPALGRLGLPTTANSTPSQRTGSTRRWISPRTCCSRNCAARCSRTIACNPTNCRVPH